MPELITFGETMAVLTPREPGPLRYCPELRLRFGGAESNTAIGAAKLGHTAGWFSRVGTDEIGAAVVSAVRAEGVDVSRVLYDDAHRTGLLLKQPGSGETKVWYYREHSAASFLDESDLPYDYLNGAKILHLTGITPALSDSCRRAVLSYAEAARGAGVKVSFDPNIRRKLWGAADYRPILREMLCAAQIALLGLDEAADLLGTNLPGKIADILLGAGVETVAIKNGANGGWYADAGGIFPFAPVPCTRVDPVGAGDAFNAAFLCGLLEGRTLDECAKMGAVSGAMATETTGDVEGLPDRRQMEARMRGIPEIYR